jgi:hypothetical protein
LKLGACFSVFEALPLPCLGFGCDYLVTHLHYLGELRMVLILAVGLAHAITPVSVLVRVKPWFCESAHIFASRCVAVLRFEFMVCSLKFVGKDFDYLLIVSCFKGFDNVFVLKRKAWVNGVLVA